MPGRVHSVSPTRVGVASICITMNQWRAPKVGRAREPGIVGTECAPRKLGSPLAAFKMSELSGYIKYISSQRRPAAQGGAWPLDKSQICPPAWSSSAFL